MKGIPQDWRDAKLAELAIGRFGDVEEVAPTVVLLASDPGSYYVGATMPMNGPRSVASCRRAWFNSPSANEQRAARGAAHDHAVGDTEPCCDGGMCFARYFEAYLHKIIRVVRSRADYAG
jgi:hypothetical protein